MAIWHCSSRILRSSIGMPGSIHSALGQCVGPAFVPEQRGGYRRHTDRLAPTELHYGRKTQVKRYGPVSRQPEIEDPSSYWCRCPEKYAHVRNPAQSGRPGKLVHTTTETRSLHGNVASQRRIRRSWAHFGLGTCRVSDPNSFFGPVVWLEHAPAFRRNWLGWTIHRHAEGWPQLQP